MRMSSRSSFHVRSVGVRRRAKTELGLRLVDISTNVRVAWAAGTDECMHSCFCALARGQPGGPRAPEDRGSRGRPVDA